MERRAKLKVANIVEEGKVGGPQLRLVQVAKDLADRVDTLVVMPRNNSERFRNLCEASELPYRAIPLTRLTKEFAPALAYVCYSLFEPFAIAKLFRKEGIDLVHVSGGSWQFKGVLAARLAGKPVVWHLNDTYVPGFIRRIFRSLSRYATGFIFASYASYDYYRDLCPPETVARIVPSVVNTERFAPDNVEFNDQDSALLDAWGEDLVVGTVGNVNPVKDTETFVRAAATLPNTIEGRKLRFVVVGPISTSQESYHRRLVALAEELELGTIEFVGGRNDVRSLLNRFDVYVCSSAAESSPMSVWEAMAMKKALVSTDVGDVRRHVVDGENGFVVHVAHPADIAEKVEAMLRNPELRERLGSRAREVAEAEFAPEKISALTLAAYDDTLTAHRT